MSTKDISRFLFQPRKRYSGVRMQQGRVILDSDWNEAARIEEEQQRRTNVDVIGASGTPNNGFLIGEVTSAIVSAPAAPGEDPTQKETYDFSWGTGSFHIGGIRFETDSEVGERFLSQADWLQLDADLDNLPAMPTVDDLTNPDGTTRTRHDLVYLRGSVAAVEDSELRERALGGPDTSVRMRRQRRVEILEEVSDGCSSELAQLQDRLTAGDPDRFEPANAELLSKTRLTVTFVADGTAEDLCAPSVRAGFLGADNQSIRVQLTAGGRFIWGFDNASPPYRVQVRPVEGALSR